mmetsp:Transcript_15852/g.18705  ORF Transcript_15852/g.18705 Transcript_15852/m.18705 type:complete len:439 (+) Transcript_15852:58-1374(+)
MSSPRIAVVGGGISGTLCSLILRNRGLTPVVFDKGHRQSGGRLGGGMNPDSGAQFIRGTDPRVVNVLAMLQGANILEEWKGRFGFLGSKGGFLSAEVVGTSSIHAMGKENELVLQGNDEGDFCGFINNRGKTYVGHDSMATICANILKECSVEVHTNSTLLQHIPPTFNTTSEDETWKLQFEGQGEVSPLMKFDGLVITTHDPILAAGVVDSILKTSDAQIVDQWESTEKQLKAFSSDLRHTTHTSGCTLSAYYPVNALSSVLPFDAVSLPSSHILQFLSRDASKPARKPSHFIDINGSTKTMETELWTAVATAQFSESMRANQKGSLPNRWHEEKALSIMNRELSRLLSLYFNKDEAAVPQPVSAHAKFWGRAFIDKGLVLNEDCVGLEPWSVVVAGDFIRKMTSAVEDGPSSPFEAAALSGLDAGERMASFFNPTQ